MKYIFLLLFTYIAFAQPSGFTDNLISVWEVDSTTTPEFRDEWGYNHLTNAGLTDVVGKLGRAGYCNTTYATIPTNTSLDIVDDDFTVTTWVNLQNNVAVYGLCGKDGQSTDRQWNLVYVNTTDVFHFSIFRDDGTKVGSVEANNLGSPSLATWYFIAIWHDKTLNRVYIQVNGGTVDSAATTGVIATETGPFNIGSINDGALASKQYEDQTCFWKRVLTAEDRAWLYNSGSGRVYTEIVGNSYYIDVDKGANTNNGRTPATAWADYDSVNTIPDRSFVVGDSFLQRTGTIIRQTVTWPMSGVADSVMTLTCYDSATGLTGSSVTGDLPEINGADLVDTWVVVGGGVYYSLGMSTEPKLVARNDVVGTLWATKSSGVGADSTQFWTTAGSDTLFIYTATASDTLNIEAGQRNYCFFAYEKSYFTVEYIEMKYSNTDAVFYRGSDTATQTGGIFDNLTISYSGSDGIQIGRSSGTRIPDTVTVSNCTVSYWGRFATAKGILFEKADSGGVNFNITDNTVFSDVVPTLGSSNSYNGIEVRCGTDILIENNEVYAAGHAIVVRGDSATSGRGSSISNTRYNYTHDNGDDAIWLEGIVGTANVYYNIFDADSGDNAIDVSGATINIYNNLLLNAYQDALNVEAYPTTLNFKNNIVFDWSEINAQTRKAIFYAADGANPTIGSSAYDNNIYYSSSGKNIAVLNSVTMETLGEWQDSTSQDANSLTSDPLFTDAANNNFLPLGNSPALEAGVFVGFLGPDDVDYAGNPIEYPPDIGAYEFDSGVECSSVGAFGFPKFPAYNTFLSGIGGSAIFPYIFPFCLE